MAKSRVIAACEGRRHWDSSRYQAHKTAAADLAARQARIRDDFAHKPNNLAGTSAGEDRPHHGVWPLGRQHLQPTANHPPPHSGQVNPPAPAGGGCQLNCNLMSCRPLTRSVSTCPSLDDIGCSQRLLLDASCAQKPEGPLPRAWSMWSIGTGWPASGVEHLEAALAGQGRRIMVADPGEMTDDLVRDMIEVPGCTGIRPGSTRIGCCWGPTSARRRGFRSAATVAVSARRSRCSRRAARGAATGRVEHHHGPRRTSAAKARHPRAAARSPYPRPRHP
jgi:hypothetical protein